MYYVDCDVDLLSVVSMHNVAQIASKALTAFDHRCIQVTDN